MSNSEKQYTSDGFLIVSELEKCPFFEASSPSPSYREDCFFCRFSDFRKPDYIEELKNDASGGVLFSTCHNERNKKQK